MESTKKVTIKQLNSLQEKSKIYLAGAGRGNTKELDVAIIKSTTNQFHVVPKEKHVRTLKNAVHPAKPRREVQYLIVELLKRLYTANDWVIALKTLVVVHRLMRETDPSFIEELLKAPEEPVGLSSSMSRSQSMETTKGGHILRVDDFLDMSAGSEGRFEFSEWVRAYGRYLDEQLDVYSSINFCLETEEAGSESRMRSLNTQDLLFQLPKLQRLLQRLTDCVPRGSTAKDPIVQLSLLMVVKESFKLYKAVSEGVINLADTFFEMSHLDAAKGLEIYKQYTAFTDLLQTYYTQVDQIEEIRSSLKQPLDFHLATPPPEFLAQMEEYVREAPRALEDGSVAPAPTKISPLRRGQHSSRTGQRPSSGMGHHNDPGMVFPPGGGAPIGSQELSSPREEAVAPAAVAGEIDLLALDFEQEVAVDTSSVSAVPVQDSNGPLAELFAVNSSFSSAPGGSLGAPAGNPFGTPAPLSMGGGGFTGFTEPPGPVPSQHSPQLPPAPMPFAAPSGLVPMAGPSTNASRESLHSSVNGTGLPPTEEPSPAKGPDGTNIRDSALHDPFAQFNSLRSSNEVKAPSKPMPSMQALRASGGQPLPGAYTAPSVQHSPPSAGASLAAGSFGGPSSGSYSAGGPAGGPAFAPTGSTSFSTAPAPVPGFGNGAFGYAPPPGTSQSFTVALAGQPAYATPVPQHSPAQGGGFPVRFDTPGGAGLL